MINIMKLTKLMTGKLKYLKFLNFYMYAFIRQRKNNKKYITDILTTEAPYFSYRKAITDNLYKHLQINYVPHCILVSICFFMVLPKISGCLKVCLIFCILLRLIDRFINCFIDLC